MRTRTAAPSDIIAFFLVSSFTAVMHSMESMQRITAMKEKKQAKHMRVLIECN